MSSGIYQITCLVNERRYIGSSVDMRARWRDHRSALVSKRHHNIHIQRAWNKYGADNFSFEVLEEAEPIALKAAEERWLASEKPEFNINPRADAPMRGKKHTPEALAKIAAAGMGRVVSKKTRKLLSRLITGKKLGQIRSEEFKENVRRQNTPERRAKIREGAAKYWASRGF
jgi:group I intron endonuclease